MLVGFEPFDDRSDMQLRHHLRSNRRSELERLLGNAKRRLRRAEADVDDLEGQLAVMDAEDELEVIRSWRGEPDWSELLSSDRGMHLYMLRQQFLYRMRLHPTGGSWADVGQAVIGVGVPTDPDPEVAARYVAEIAAGLRVVLPHLAPHADGLVWLTVTGANIEGYSPEIRLSRDLSTVRYVRMTYGTAEGTVECASLGEALFHAQQEHPYDAEMYGYVPDPADAPGETGQALREAMEAFVEGTRTVGTPIAQGTSVSIGPG